MLLRYLRLRADVTSQPSILELLKQLEPQEEARQGTGFLQRQETSATTSPPHQPAEEEKKVRLTPPQADSQAKLLPLMRKLCGQVAPLLDRMGRLMADIAPHFAVLASSSHESSTEPTFVPQPAAAESPDHPSPLESIMPPPGDIASLVGLTEEQLDREPSINVHTVILAVTNPHLPQDHLAPPPDDPSQEFPAESIATQTETLPSFGGPASLPIPLPASPVQHEAQAQTEVGPLHVPTAVPEGALVQTASGSQRQATTEGAAGSPGADANGSLGRSSDQAQSSQRPGNIQKNAEGKRDPGEPL